MKISMEQLEALFYGQDTLKDVLPALKEELDRSDYYDDVLIQNLTDNAEACKSAVNEITGLHGKIVKAYHFSEGALDVMEPKAKSRLRKELTVAGQPKPTDGAVTAAAEEAVSQYRRVRYYLMGYVKGLDKSISTLQSILKYEGSPKGTISRSTQQSNQ
jgi:hypothetical protein